MTSQAEPGRGCISFWMPLSPADGPIHRTAEVKNISFLVSFFSPHSIPLTYTPYSSRHWKHAKQNVDADSVASLVSLVLQGPKLTGGSVERPSAVIMSLQVANVRKFTHPRGQTWLARKPTEFRLRLQKSFILELNFVFFYEKNVCRGC